MPNPKTGTVTRTLPKLSVKPKPAKWNSAWTKRESCIARSARFSSTPHRSRQAFFRQFCGRRTESCRSGNARFRFVHAEFHFAGFGFTDSFATSAVTVPVFGSASVREGRVLCPSVRRTSSCPAWRSPHRNPSSLPRFFAPFHRRRRNPHPLLRFANFISARKNQHTYRFAQTVRQNYRPAHNLVGMFWIHAQIKREFHRFIKLRVMRLLDQLRSFLELYGRASTFLRAFSTCFPAFFIAILSASLDPASPQTPQASTTSRPMLRAVQKPYGSPSPDLWC